MDLVELSDEKIQQLQETVLLELGLSGVVGIDSVRTARWVSQAVNILEIRVDLAQIRAVLHETE